MVVPGLFNSLERRFVQRPTQVNALDIRPNDRVRWNYFYRHLYYLLRPTAFSQARQLIRWVHLNQALDMLTN